MAVFGLAALVTWESTSAFIDLALTLFASLGLLWATRAGDLSASVGLAAVFAGLAAGSKLTGGVAALQAAVIAAAFTLSPSHRQRRKAVRALGIVVAGAFALALPWYLRNVSFTGNPVFPVGNLWLGLPEQPLAFSRYGYGRDLLHLLTSPFDLVWRGDAFDKGWAIGPAYLALVPVGIAVTWATKVGRAACALVLSWWIMWFFSSPQTRLLLPILPTAAGLASAGAVAVLGSPERWLRRAAVVLLGSAALLGVAFAVLAVKTYGPVALGLEDREAFLARMSWHFAAFEATNARLGPRDRVAVFGADNLFYLRVPAETRRELETPAVLRERGFTHVLDIAPCGRPSRLAASSLLWRGRYRLRASRMGGGTQGEETCAELGSTALQPSSDVEGGGARAAAYAPFSSARSPYE
jgi:4-amino-4-deoxy-L-arabinose transferase-like glycosyltransferase